MGLVLERGKRNGVLLARHGIRGRYSVSSAGEESGCLYMCEGAAGVRVVLFCNEFAQLSSQLSIQLSSGCPLMMVENGSRINDFSFSGSLVNCQKDI